MEHSKQPEKFGFKLLVSFCLDVFTIQPDFLTWYIAPGLHPYIMSSLLEVLSMQKVLVINVYQLPQFHSQSIG